MTNYNIKAMYLNLTTTSLTTVLTINTSSAIAIVKNSVKLVHDTASNVLTESIVNENLVVVDYDFCTQ
jgi:hypothetical protein